MTEPRSKADLNRFASNKKQAGNHLKYLESFHREGCIFILRFEEDCKFKPVVAWNKIPFQEKDATFNGEIVSPFEKQRGHAVHFYDYKGNTVVLKKIADLESVSQSSLYRRVKRGMSIEEAVAEAKETKRLKVLRRETLAKEKKQVLGHLTNTIPNSVFQIGSMLQVGSFE